MGTGSKVVLSIPSVLPQFYIIALMFPTEFDWVFPSWTAYYIQVGLMQALGIIQIIILLRKLWSFKKIDRKLKVDWTWLLILFTSIASLILIWKKVDQFEKMNEQHV